MHYSCGIVRPPYEANSVYLQVTAGCTHNTCRFCTFFKEAPFSVSPESEIIEDLEELASYGVRFPRIFLQAADPFTLSFERLVRIKELIDEYLPWGVSVGGYGRVDSLRNKTVEQLKQLKEMGYEMMIFGIESGDDAVLEKMNKGYKSADIVEQLSKMDQAGLTYSVIFLGGLGGAGYGTRAAEATAAVLNQLHPSRVLASGLTIFEDTPLMEEVRAGQFTEAAEAEKVEELYTLIDSLEIETLFDATNVSNMIPVIGFLPESKEEMLHKLRSTMERYGEDWLRMRRDNMVSL